MSALTPLVPQAQPALRRVPAAATAGATWRWVVAIADSSGNPVNLTGMTAVCKIIDSAGAEVASPTVTLGNGTFTVELDETLTAGLATGQATRCAWSLTVSDGTDVVQFWGVDGSPFVIYPAA
jgi:hypothetical protein